MTRYEMKKIFVRRSTKFAFMILGGVLAVVFYFMLADTSWVNQEGKTETGFTAIRNMREAKNKWSGPLTEEKIGQIIEENNRINQTPEAKSEEIQKQEIAFGWKQGYSDIRLLLCYSFGKFQETDYYRMDALTPDAAADFYTNRLRNLQEWLAEEGNGADAFSDKEKQFLTDRYSELSTPFLYEYQDGWKNLFQWSPAILMITTMVLGFLCAGIFSDEFRLKASAVFYSAYYGRSKAIGAKLKAGFLLVTVIYWSVILIYSGVTFLIFGTDGMLCPIQCSASGWKSFYNINNGQEFLIVMTGGYIGCMFMAALVMLVSATVKSSLLAVTVPFILIFLPSFLSGISSPLLNKVLGLLPDQLLQMNMAVKYFNLYHVCGKTVGAVPMLIGTYFVLIFLLIPIIYRTYKKHQAVG